jgi:Tfp pilus assembly protein PilF
MSKAGWVLVGGWVVAAGVLASGAAQAGSPEVDFAKGVVAFSRKDYPRAEEHFSAVLREQPQNPRAIYYLGQILFLSDRIDEAVERFRQALALGPEMTLVRVDLAQALIRRGDFAAAETELRLAAPSSPDRAAVQYFLGFCLYQMGRYQDSIEHLMRARDLDQGFGASAGYYLGLAQARSGKIAEAKESFRALAFGTENPDISDMARHNLSVLGASRPRARSFGVFATAGGGYDSNVALQADQGSGSGSARLFLAAGGYLNLLQDERQNLAASFSLSQSLYLGNSMSGFDLTDVSAFIGYRRALGRLRFEAGYQGSLDWLSDIGLGNPTRAGDRDMGLYLHSHTGRGAVRVAESGHAGTSLEYGFSAKMFDYDLRNSFEHAVMVVQDLAWDPILSLEIKAGVVVADAYGDEWDMWSPDIEARVRYQPASWLDLSFQAGFRRESYYHYPFGPERLDLRVGLGGAVALAIGESLSLSAQYWFFSNDSNQPFSYRRNLVNLSITGQL